MPERQAFAKILLTMTKFRPVIRSKCFPSRLVPASLANMSNASYFDEEEEVSDYTGFEDEDPGYLDLSSPSMSLIDEDLLSCQDLAEPVAELSQPLLNHCQLSPSSLLSR